jgi:hypothetical protein
MKNRKGRGRPGRNGVSRGTGPNVMFSTTYEGIFHAWLRYEPLSAAERRWLEQAVELGIRYGREVSDDLDCQGIDVAIVGRTAEALWAASPSSPHWRDLDPEAALARVERMCGREWRDNAVASLMGFTHFLTNCGKLTAGEALVIRSRLDPFVPPVMVAAGYQPVVLPPSLQPS